MIRLLLLNVFLVFTISINAQGWGEIQKSVPNDRAIGDNFGYAMAMQGEYAIISARNKATTSSNNGAVYVYKQDVNGDWNQEQRLTQSNIRQFDGFGDSVAIDGNYLIVGCRGQDYDENENNSVSAAGAAYIFEKDGGGIWSQAQKLAGTDRTALDVFGDSVDLSGDYAIVSAPWEDEDENEMNTLAFAGSAFIFEKDAGGVWQRVQKIVASDRSENVQFGDKAVAIDGNYIAVGVWRQFSDAAGENNLSGAGAVYIFERDTNGVWNEVQKIVASDREQGEWFGRSVGINGNTLIVGASKEYLAGNTNAQYGAVYVFERDSGGIWNEVQKMRSSDLQNGSQFGSTLDLDGDHVIIGAYLHDVGNSGDGGAAFVFEKDGTGLWSQVAEMYDPDVSSGDYFGYDVAMSGDYAIAGAYEEEEDENGVNTMQSAGSAYIFDVNEPNTLGPLNTLSILDNSFSTSIKVYPNPVSDVLNIDLGESFNSVDIKISNLLGQQVFYQNYRQIQSIELSLDLAKGMYLIEVKIDSVYTSVFKIIKP